jgi:hypothetical protein
MEADWHVRVGWHLQLLEGFHRSEVTGAALSSGYNAAP